MKNLFHGNILPRKSFEQKNRMQIKGYFIVRCNSLEKFQESINAGKIQYPGCINDTGALMAGDLQKIKELNGK